MQIAGSFGDTTTPFEKKAQQDAAARNYPCVPLAVAFQAPGAESPPGGSSRNKMNCAIPILTDQFYQDGRGPELNRVVWNSFGQDLAGFEYVNPDDPYDQEHIRHLILERTEAYSMAPEILHRRIFASSDGKAAIFLIEESSWKRSFHNHDVRDSFHFQIVFYDEIFDVICQSISAGEGPFPQSQAEQGTALRL